MSSARDGPSWNSCHWKLDAADPQHAADAIPPRDRISTNARSRSLAGQMTQIPVVLVANELQQFGVGQKMDFLVDSPWSRVRFGIVDGDLKIHVAEVLAPETLDNMQGFGGRLA